MRGARGAGPVPRAPGAPRPDVVEASERLTVLLVEDDDGDALLVEEHLADANVQVDLVRAVTLDEAVEALRTTDVHCVLLDLGLPDSVGLSGVERLRDAPAPPALVVLTGRTDADDGVRAVAAGADDYLVKSDVGPELLARSVRYAVQRRRAAAQQRELDRSQLRAAETARLERALLPRPLVHDESLSVVVGYLPGGNGLLGGDFYDAVELDDGTVVCVIGDVAGHGPDEAALGATLRTAWRTLVVTGTPPARIIADVERVLLLERPRPEVFATLCQVVVHPRRQTAEVYLAGHLAPLLLGPDGCTEVDASSRGRAIGVPVDGGWSAVTVTLGAPWSLLLYTDGLVEATVGRRPVVAAGAPEDAPRPAHERVGAPGLRRVVTQARQEGGPGLVERVLRQVRTLHGGPLDDDAAILLVGESDAPVPGERGATLADSEAWER
ncbi:serine phosphatase RsbU (regulator of sigma subunit) [Cellulomonas sp. PhB143]|nr:serine phosphatase RsbU (regulator of sigma subunit) [Cellulomonas sp. PhB143]